MQTQPLDANLCICIRSHEKGCLADFFYKRPFCLVFKEFIYLNKALWDCVLYSSFLCIVSLSPTFSKAFLGGGSRFLGVVLVSFSFYMKHDHIHDNYSNEYVEEQCVMGSQIFEELPRPHYQWTMVLLDKYFFLEKMDLNFGRKSN